MNKRKIYTKPTMTILTMDTTTILAGSDKITQVSDLDFEVEFIA